MSTIKNPSFRCRLVNEKWMRITVSRDTIQFEEWANGGWSHLPNITKDEPVSATTFSALQALVLEAAELFDEEMDPDEWEGHDYTPHEDDEAERLEAEAAMREWMKTYGEPDA